MTEVDADQNDEIEIEDHRGMAFHSNEFKDRQTCHPDQILASDELELNFLLAET